MKPLCCFGQTRLDSAAASGLELVLREKHPLRLAGALGRRLVCVAGCVWVTAPGVREDIFLYPGDAWRIASDGKVLIEAFGSATVTLAAPE